MSSPGQCQFSQPAKIQSLMPVLVNNISPWMDASWKIVEWNVPPGFGFGNPKYCCLEVQGCLKSMVVSRLIIPAMAVGTWTRKRGSSLLC